MLCCCYQTCNWNFFLLYAAVTADNDSVIYVNIRYNSDFYCKGFYL